MMDVGTQLNGYFAAITSGSEPLQDVHDRYFTTEVDYASDGVRLDRDGLIEHSRSVRANMHIVELEVSDAVRQGSRAAVRGILRATPRSGPGMALDVCLFVTFSGDGRLSQVEQLSRPR